METKIYNQAGKATGTIALPEKIFGLKWNADLIHQVVTSMMNNLRNPIAHAKGRGEVRGGGKKPWRQKGTGRARHGSSRSPIWVGGGVTHGPNKETNYSRKINQKMRSKALAVLLSAKLRDGEIIFVDSLKLSEGKTKQAKVVLSTLGGIKGFESIVKKNKNALYLAMFKKDASVTRAFQNFGNLKLGELRNLNALDLLNTKILLIDQPKEAVEYLTSRLTK